MLLQTILAERGRAALNPTAGSGEDLLRSALNRAELDALEALKLQYFQNATRFLAKGEFDSALAEIKRILVIDPEHRLAREYEARVAELQASRAQAQGTESAPPKELPRTAPAPSKATAGTAAPAPRRAPRKALLYVTLFALLLLGTTGVLTLEKANDDAQPPVAPVATVPTNVSVPASAPAARAVESTFAKDQVSPRETPAIVEPVRATVVDEKSLQNPEPVHSNHPARPATIASVEKTPVSTGSETKPISLAEAKTEPAPALAMKGALDVLPPEARAVASTPAPAAPSHETAPFIAVQQDPKIVRLEKPRLPDLVLQKHISGSVTAKVLIDQDGKPQEVKILASTDGVFEQPVIDAIGRSTFSPGMMGTGPVAAWVVIPFRFK
jgi:protein TonB